jgi:hypothetical protein
MAAGDWPSCGGGNISSGAGKPGRSRQRRPARFLDSAQRIRPKPSAAPVADLRSAS